jgi:hypothetical protein
VEECAIVAFAFCVAEEARLKIQYQVIGEQLKAVKAKKAEVMLRLKESATAVAGGGDCRRCQTLSAQVDALNHRVAHYNSGRQWWRRRRRRNRKGRRGVVGRRAPSRMATTTWSRAATAPLESLKMRRDRRCVFVNILYILCFIIFKKKIVRVHRFAICLL